MLTTRMLNRFLMSPMALSALFLLGCATNPPPETTHDGLVRKVDAATDYVYVKPGVDAREYKNLALEECDVAFRKNWLRDQNAYRRSPSQRVKQEDMDAIRSKLGELCTEEFISVLTREPSYELIANESAGEATLLLKPHIIDLDVAAPDVKSPSMTRTYTTESGEMTLFLEIADAVTGETLFRIVDRRRNLNAMRLQWSNSVTNAADARRVLNAWGEQFRQGLDRVYADHHNSDEE